MDNETFPDIPKFLRKNENWFGGEGEKQQLTNNFGVLLKGLDAVGVLSLCNLEVSLLYPGWYTVYNRASSGSRWLDQGSSPEVVKIYGTDFLSFALKRASGVRGRRLKDES